MHESFWGTFIISLGLIIIALIFFMQKFTNNSEQNYLLLKETTEAALKDSFDLETYSNTYGQVIRINREAFVESFLRRFAQNASLSNTYVVEIYDINECPPKVSIQLKTKNGAVVMNREFDFDTTNRIDAILETTY
ncbi:MAG: hypothetical protein J6D28_03370 [Bacilli bacterium]|nr:hypothetical protein [Bacilli bacterium]